MTIYLAVRRAPGAAWVRGVPMRSQPLWGEHAAFMDALVEENFVVLGGPIGKEEDHEALLIFDAHSEEAVRERLSQDPWSLSAILLIRSIEKWTILLDGRPAG